MNYLFALTCLFILVVDITKAEIQSDCQIDTIQKKQKKSYLHATMSANKGIENNDAVKLPELRYQIINKISHDQLAYTEGLLFYQDFIYESIGLVGLSELRKIDPANGKIVRQTKLSNQYFAEGIALLNNDLIQFTLKKNIALVYDSNSLELLNKYLFDSRSDNRHYDSSDRNNGNKTNSNKTNLEVWGATNLGQQIMLSDGSSLLRLVEPLNNKTSQINQVLVGKNKLYGMNEIEWVKGLVLANVWPTDCIAVIRVADYQVVAWLNLSDLNPNHSRAYQSSVLNGIAYNAEQDIFYITGKNWPFIYQIKVTGLPFESPKINSRL